MTARGLELSSRSHGAGDLHRHGALQRQDHEAGVCPALTPRGSTSAIRTEASSHGHKLTFKAQPDFEDPADADQDNVYEVTVVVSDPAGNSDEVDVRVTVTNVKELGTITFSTLQPKVGIALTADAERP